MRHLIIIGTGAFARELYWHAQDSLGFGVEWEIKGCLDGDSRLPEEEYAKLEMPVLGSVADYVPAPGDVFVCAVGQPQAKQRLVQAIMAKGGTFLNVIHKTALLQGNVRLGTGVIICPWCYVNDHAVVGSHVMLNMHTGLGHDVCIGDFSSCMCNVSLAGYVKAGALTYWGDNAVALPGSRIDDQAFVGAGSVVLKRVRAGVKVFGNPAVPIGSND